MATERHMPEHEETPGFVGNIPDKTLEALREYVASGRPLGRFLRAVVEHRLEAILFADPQNKRAIEEIFGYLHWDAPAECHGSPEAYTAWTVRGGWNGIRRKLEDEEHGDRERQAD